MDLILTVVECPPHANMLNHTKVFHSGGGVIGRADSSDWVLPDTERILSSKHMEVTFAEGCFSVLDHSTNGTFVNEQQAPLGPGKPYELKSGDILICGEYQLKVSMKGPKAAPAIPSDLGAVDFLDAGDRTTFNHATAGKQQAATDASNLDSWLEPATPAPRSGTHGDNNDWGAAPAPAASAPSSVSSDPWGASPESGTSDFLNANQNSDPLAALVADSGSPASVSDQKGGSLPGWNDSDDWWKSGSAPDHAPVEQQQMRVPQPQGASSVQTSAVPASSVATAADDPFAASLDAVSSAGAGQDQGIDSLFGIPAGAAELSTTDIPPPPLPKTPAQPESSQVNVAVEVAAPSQGSAPASGTTADVRELAASLGIEKLSDEQLQSLMPEVSGIVNEAVTRLIDLLRARTAIKNELRVQHTMIQTMDNNPLKFSANATDALKMMFTSDASAFMRPRDAVRDSFDDLSDHQVAVLKGMNGAYQAMLKHFDPEHLKQHMTVRDSLLGNKDAKHWLAYEQYYKSLRGDYESTYNLLFGEDFARTYERELAELKNNRALNRS